MWLFQCSLSCKHLLEHGTPLHLSLIKQRMWLLLCTELSSQSGVCRLYQGSGILLHHVAILFSIAAPGKAKECVKKKKIIIIKSNIQYTRESVKIQVECVSRNYLKHLKFEIYRGWSWSISWDPGLSLVTNRTCQVLRKGAEANANSFVAVSSHLELQQRENTVKRMKSWREQVSLQCGAFWRASC